MARALSASLLTALQAGVVKPVVFYEGEFSGGTIRLWSGVGSYSWNGETWTGAGNMLNVGNIPETSSTTAQGFVVSLSGQLSSLVAIALAQCRSGLPGRVWLGCFDTDGSLISDPFKAFDGRLDVPNIEDGGEMTTITVSYESRLIDMQVARERRYTDEDQKIDYPEDTGFHFVPSLQDKTLTWGKG